MTGLDRALAELGNACVAQRRAEHELALAKERKALALRAIHGADVPKCHVASVAVDYLVLHGFDVSGLALSPASVRLVLGGRDGS